MVERLTHDPAGQGTQSADIAEELQRRILLGEIPVGTWLRHEALAAEFGTSRTPVREALHVLNAQGVVTIVRNRGACVNGHSARDIKDVGEVRAELEGFAAFLAAQRIDDRQLARLKSAWEDFRIETESYAGSEYSQRTAADAQRWVEANERFHDTVLEASGNDQLRQIIDEAHRRLPKNTSYAAYAGNARLIRRNLDEHDAIAGAIERGDADAARQAMSAHIRISVDATVRWAEEQGLVRS